MKQIKGKYLIPNGEDYEQVFLETEAAQVIESDTKVFVKPDERDYIRKEKENIVLKKDIVSGYTSSATDKAASAKDVQELSKALGGLVIIQSKTKPQPQEGKTILWIELE